MSKIKKKTEKQKRFDLKAKELKRSQKGKTQREILDERTLNQKKNLFRGASHIMGYYFFPGVYMLFRDMELVYIGESSCIMTRICQHWNSDKDFNHIKIYDSIMDGKERKVLEKKLIKKYRPILNIAHNDNLKFKNDKRQVRG